MPMHRHGVAGAVIGNEFTWSADDADRWRDDILDPQLETRTAVHDVLELNFNPTPPAGAPNAAGSRLANRAMNNEHPCVGGTNRMNKRCTQ